MKTTSLLLMLLFFSCGKESSLSPNLQRCTLSDSGWIVVKVIHNIEGTIVLDTANTYLISFEDSNQTGWHSMLPCNLPENYKIPNSRVKISGKIYTYPRLDYAYDPIELTSIRFTN
jgi:hypothetical protein